MKPQCGIYHAFAVLVTIIPLSIKTYASPPELIVSQNDKWTSLNKPQVTDNLELVSIDVSFNDVANIGISLEQHESLRVLTLSGNTKFRLTADDELNLNCKSLETLNCDGCGVQVLTVTSFARLPHLTTLNLNSNRLRQIPSNLFRSMGVISFAASRNRELSLRPNAVLMDTNTLQSFSCEECNLTIIDIATLSKMPALRQLRLNGNHIAKVDSRAFEQNVELSVHLEKNQLREFPVDALNVFDNKKRNVVALCLDGNPFVPSANNNQLKKRYFDVKLRLNCTPVSTDKYFTETLADWIPPTTSTTTTVITPTTSTPEKGISDAFIASYLTLIVIIQGVVVTMLVLYLVKTIYRNKDDVFDYSAGVLNDYDIYNVLK